MQFDNETTASVYDVNSAIDLVAVFRNALASGDLITGMIFDGHGDEQGDLFLTDSQYIQIDDLSQLLQRYQDAFDPNVYIEYDACYSADGQNSAAYITSNLFPGATVVGYTGGYNSWLNIAVSNDWYAMASQYIACLSG